MMKEFIGGESEKRSLLRAGWTLAAVLEMVLPFLPWAIVEGRAFSPALYWLDISGMAWASRLAGVALLTAALTEAALLFFLWRLLFRQERPGGAAFFLPGFLAAGILAAALIFREEIRPLWPAWAALAGGALAFALSAGEKRLDGEKPVDSCTT